MSDTNDEQHKASAGGHARAAKLTPEERREIARHAARVRWANRADDRKLSPKEIERLALIYATQDREAFADERKTPQDEAEEARDLAKAFRHRLKSRFGEDYDQVWAEEEEGV